jgi:flagella basal body P-ring formation protein FlgA
MKFRTAILGLLWAATAAALAAGDDSVVRLRLRGAATVSGAAAMLGDVLTVEGDDEALTRLIQQAPAAEHGEPITLITPEQVLRRLDQLGVNLARVLLCGPTECQIRQPAAAADAATGDGAPLLRTSGASSSDIKTLADSLRAYINLELKDLGQPEVRLERAGQEFLELTTPPWEFQITSVGRDKLGSRSFHVVIRRDGQTQRRVDLFAHVQLVRSVVVAKRPLNAGNFVRAEDLGVETRQFERADNLGLAHVEEAVGQQVKRFIPSGEMLSKDTLKTCDLVVRSRPVTITGDAANIEVRLSGVALDSGTYGDAVRVRLGDARHEKKILQGIVTGLGTVKLTEGSL